MPGHVPSPVHTRWLAGQGGCPWEQGQQQEHGAQHAGLRQGHAGLAAEVPVRQHPGPACPSLGGLFGRRGVGAAGCWADIRAGAQGLLGLRAILPDLWLSG